MTRRQITDRWNDFQRQARERRIRIDGESLPANNTHFRRRIIQLQQQRGLGYAQAEQDFDRLVAAVLLPSQADVSHCEFTFAQLFEEEMARWDDDGGAGCDAELQNKPDLSSSAQKDWRTGKRPQEENMEQQ